jgi:Protein of unknown function (DUF2794)
LGNSGCKTLANKQKPTHIGTMNVENPSRLAPARTPPEQVHFQKAEINLIMALYGRMVALGEWRDYGMSALSEVAVFSIFRRSAEYPLYRIEKRPKLAAKQGMYSLIAMDGRILRRGSDLRTVLRVLERKLIRAVDHGA